MFPRLINLSWTQHNVAADTHTSRCAADGRLCALQDRLGLLGATSDLRLCPTLDARGSTANALAPQKNLDVL